MPPAISRRSGNPSLVTLQTDFTGGSVQDKPRDRLPDNAAWLLTDMFPEMPTINISGNQSPAYPLSGRYAWSRPYNVMTTGTTAAACGFAPFSAGSRILGINTNGTLFKWTPGAAGVTSVGSAVVPAHQPIFCRNYAYILDVAGTATGYRYDGTTLSNISGTPPTGSVGCVFKDHLVIARSAALPNRVWFSNVGDPTAWDTAADGQWLDAARSVQGLAVFQNMILVFEEGQTERIRGDIIPGVVGSDYVCEPIFRVGCSDPASIAVYDAGVVWANSEGIFMTDGLLPYDLTQMCGMSSFWRDYLVDYGTSVTIAGAIYRGWYVFSVTGSGAPIAGAINLKTKAFVKLTNVFATMLASAPNGVIDIPASLIGSELSYLYVADYGTMLDASPASPSVTDPAGTAYVPIIETRFYQADHGPRRWGSLYLSGSGTSATIKYVQRPDASTGQYSTLTSSFTFAGSSSPNERNRVAFNKTGRGFGLQISAASNFYGSNPQSNFRLSAIEAEMSTLYGRRT